MSHLTQWLHSLLQDFWKLPTGLLSLGEDIPEGAEREVLEETGIVASFKAVLAVRQSHGYLFGRSDLFFVCAMRYTDLLQDFDLSKNKPIEPVVTYEIAN